MAAKPLHQNSASDPDSFYFAVCFFSTFESFLQGYVQVVISLGSPATSKMSSYVFERPYPKILYMSLENPVL